MTGRQPAPYSEPENKQIKSRRMIKRLLKKLKKIRQGRLKNRPRAWPDLPGPRLIERLEKSLNYKIKNPALFEEAFTHKGRQRAGRHNERLEFLGDAVLSLAVTDSLMREHPAATEGDMTKIRGALVSGQSLAQIAAEMDFGALLKTAAWRDRRNPRLLAGALEACLGAVYLDGGYPAANRVIMNMFQEKITKKIFSADYKSELQEWSQKKYRLPPEYRLRKAEGPQHKKTFHVDALVNRQVYGSGSDRQKKQAEQNAAKAALKRLKAARQ